jgi:hypothetical protein
VLSYALYDPRDFGDPNITSNQDESEAGGANTDLGRARRKILEGPPELILFRRLLNFLTDFHDEYGSLHGRDKRVGREREAEESAAEENQFME